MKGLSSTTFVLFFVSFISILGFFILIYNVNSQSAPFSQPIVQYNNSDNTTYMIYQPVNNYSILNNVPKANLSAIECNGGIIIVDGILKCAWNYGSTFFGYLSITSSNAFLALLLFILTIVSAWVIATLYGGS